MDDYYRLLDIEPGATTEEIREAYRTRKEQLAAEDSPEARAAAGDLNRAWNVLSDPYQRGRYDASLESAGTEAAEASWPDAAPVEVVPAAAPPEAPRRRGLFAPPGGAPAPEPIAPPGVQIADQRSRLFAFVFDLSVMAVLFLGITSYLTPTIIEAVFPDEWDTYQGVVDDRDAADADLSDAQDALDQADSDLEAAQEDGDDAAIAEAQDAQATAESVRDDAQDEVDSLTDDLRDQGRDFVPVSFAMVALAGLVAYAYAAIPTALGGQTLGKRLRRVRVVDADDGGPPGWRGSLIRYGLPVGLFTVLYVLVGPLSLFLAVFTVLGWLRNPNRQGLHDRLARTQVADAS